jgi:acetylornithine/succinyldiaminopimelate/putrescine aminotransferase
MWAIEAWGVVPDLLVTGKGLSGGLYPIAAVVMTKKVGGWLSEQGWSYVSTFGGSEIGCRVALRVLEVCSRPQSVANARRIGTYLGERLTDVAKRHLLLRGVRQKGLVMGLELRGEIGAVQLSQALYRRGVWAMFSGFDLSVLQFKPGLLVSEGYCDELLQRLEAALGDVEGGR